MEQEFRKFRLMPDLHVRTVMDQKVQGDVPTAIIMHLILLIASLQNQFVIQIAEGIEFHKWRYNEAVSYLAYFQAYSNTYAPLETLKKLYEEALIIRV